MENNRTAKKVYVGEYYGNHSVGRPWKKWIDTVTESLKEVWMSGKHGEWCMIRVYGGVCEGECMGCCQEMNT